MFLDIKANNFGWNVWVQWKYFYPNFFHIPLSLVIRDWQSIKNCYGPPCIFQIKSKSQYKLTMPYQQAKIGWFMYYFLCSIFLHNFLLNFFVQFFCSILCPIFLNFFAQFLVLFFTHCFYFLYNFFAQFFSQFFVTCFLQYFSQILHNFFHNFPQIFLQFFRQFFAQYRYQIFTAKHLQACVPVNYLQSR